MTEPRESGDVGACNPRVDVVQPVSWEPDTLRSLGVIAFRAAHRVLRNRDDADDLMQASLVRLLERFDRPDNPEAWITTVATNLALRVLRRRALEDRANNLSQPEISDHDFVDRLVGRLLVDEVLDSLPTRQREALHLRFRVDLPQATVAEAMRLGVESVKTHIERARPKVLGRYEDLAGEGRED